MTAALYIFGTSHSLQCAAASVDAAKVAAYEAELRSVCKRHGISRIAEEMSDEGRAKHGVTTTLGRRVAENMGIVQHEVDLTSAERSELGLDNFVAALTQMHHDFPEGDNSFQVAFEAMRLGVRERCWIGRTLARSEWPALLICGADHSLSVQRLWLSLGLPAVVCHANYEP